MITLNSCPICKSKNITTYKNFGTAPRVEYEIMPNVKVPASILTQYYVCNSCNAIFQNPRMTDNELTSFYSEGHYRRLLNLTEEVIDKDELTRARLDTKKIKKFIKNPHNHLDIGCGKGYLLRQIKAQNKVGIEIDLKRIKVKSVKIYTNIEDVPDMKFDLVTCIHTLEHTSDPVKYLKHILKLVSKNCYFVLEVPTWQSPGGPLRLAHLFHFETTVIRRMCLDTGFRIIHEEFTPHLLLICQKK